LSLCGAATTHRCSLPHLRPDLGHDPEEHPA
jgi:hypothetical protein